MTSEFTELGSRQWQERAWSREALGDAPFSASAVLLLRVRPRQRLDDLARRRPRQALHLTLELALHLLAERPRRRALGHVDPRRERHLCANLALRLHAVFGARLLHERALVDEAGVQSVDRVRCGGEARVGALDGAEELVPGTGVSTRP